LASGTGSATARRSTARCRSHYRATVLRGLLASKRSWVARADKVGIRLMSGYHGVV